MAKYIDAEKLTLDIQRYLMPNVDDDGTVTVENAERYFLGKIAEQPIADVEEVIRCRNCKYHHWEQEPCHGKTEHFCSILKAQVFADFYCYHGAKK